MAQSIMSAGGRVSWRLTRVAQNATPLDLKNATPPDLKRPDGATEHKALGLWLLPEILVFNRLVAAVY